MKEQEFNNVDLDEMEQEEITRLVSEGYTQGRVDSEEGRKTYWELKTNTWTGED